MTPVQKAIKAAGGAAKVAAEVPYSISAVYAWSNGTRTLPADVCPTLEEMNGGAVPCEELRPDVRWAVLRRAGANTPQPNEGAIGETCATAGA